MSQYQIVSIRSEKTMTEARQDWDDYLKDRCPTLAVRHHQPRIPFKAIAVIAGVEKEMDFRIIYFEDNGEISLSIMSEITVEDQYNFLITCHDKLTDLVRAWTSEQKLADTWS